MIIILILLREIVQVWRANVHYIDCRVYPLTHFLNIVKILRLRRFPPRCCCSVPGDQWRSSLCSSEIFAPEILLQQVTTGTYFWDSTDLEVSRALAIVIFFPAYYTFWWIRYEVFKLIVLIFYHSFNLHINNPQTVLFKDFCKLNSKDIYLSLDFLLIDLDSWFRLWFT